MSKRMTMSQNSLMFPKLVAKNFDENEKREQEPEQEAKENGKEGGGFLKSKLLGSLSKLTFKKKKEITENDRIVSK